MFTMGWPLCALLPTAGLWESNIWGRFLYTWTIILSTPLQRFSGCRPSSTMTSTAINYALFWVSAMFAKFGWSLFLQRAVHPIFLSQSVRASRGGGAYFSNKTRPMYQGCIREMSCTGILANNGIFKRTRILIYLRNKTFSFISESWQIGFTLNISTVQACQVLMQILRQRFKY